MAQWNQLYTYFRSLSNSHVNFTENSESRKALFSKSGSKLDLKFCWPLILPKSTIPKKLDGNIVSCVPEIVIFCIFTFFCTTVLARIYSNENKLSPNIIQISLSLNGLLYNRIWLKFFFASLYIGPKTVECFIGPKTIGIRVVDLAIKHRSYLPALWSDINLKTFLTWQKVCRISQYDRQ